jgi:hypothetical protein
MSVIPGLLNFFERHQVGGFQEAAKILLADVVEGSFAGGEALDNLVFHLQAFQVQDAKIFLAAFPDLILLQLHGQHYTNRVRALAIRLLWKKRPESPPDRPVAARPVTPDGIRQREVEEKARAVVEKRAEVLPKNPCPPTSQRFI